MQSPENLATAFRLLARGAVERTVRAVQAEGALRIIPGGPTNAERRGSTGAPEPPKPQDTQVRQAADEQMGQIMELLQQRQTASAAAEQGTDAGAPDDA